MRSDGRHLGLPRPAAKAIPLRNLQALADAKCYDNLALTV